MADVYIIVSNRARDGVGGHEGEFISAFQFGDGMKAEMLTAWALGREQVRRQEQISRLVHKQLAA